MIKRDTIQRYIFTPIEDQMGGASADKEPKELVKANVSLNTTYGEIAQFGIKQQLVIHVTTDIKLDEYVNARYKYSDKFFKLMRQIKSGNEWFSSLVEVDN